MLSFLKRVLLILGIVTLAYAGATIAESYVMQRYETSKFDRALALPAKIATEEVVHGDPIGKLTIPSAGISAIVLEGADGGTLKIAPGHIPGTALPGENGNVAIAGHRDTFFRKLEGIRSGDSMTLTSLKGVYQYKVDSMEVVDPARTDVLESSGSSTLTLVTCYPFHFIGPAPKRFIVHGHLVHTYTLNAHKDQVHGEQRTQPTDSGLLAADTYMVRGWRHDLRSMRIMVQEVGAFGQRNYVSRIALGCRSSLRVAFAYIESAAHRLIAG